MRALTCKIGTYTNCRTLSLACPFFSVLHQELANTAAAIALVYNEPPNFRLWIGYYQFGNIDMNPANHMPVRQFGDGEGMVFILLYLIKASLNFFLRCGVAQLLAERGDTLGIPCGRRSNNYSHLALSAMKSP